MKPVKLENPDIVLRGPADMPQCGELTATIEIDEHERPYFVSLWMPTIKEILALMKGGAVTLSVVGRSHPPVAIGVMDISGNPVDD